jgi:ferric-dicitrate binding protein FerR (iron transport regulator)
MTDADKEVAKLLADPDLDYAFKLDLARQHEEAETERERIRSDANVQRERYETTRHRQDTVRTVLGGLVVFVVLLAALGGLIWLLSRPDAPEDYKKSDAYREQVCVNNGGVWLPKDLLAVGHSQCFYPGKPVRP